MRSHQLFVVLCVVSMFELCESASAKLRPKLSLSNVNPSSTALPIDRLSSASPLECEKLVKVIGNRHDATILQLEEIVARNIDEPDKTANAVSAIKLLGRFRAAHAVNLLVSHLTYTEAGDQYPCVRSLILIGSPAVRSIILHSKNATDSLNLRLSARVLTAVLGVHMAQICVADEIAKTPDADALARLKMLEQMVAARKLGTDPGLSLPLGVKK